MKARILRQLKCRQRKILKRLAMAKDNRWGAGLEGPVLGPRGLQYELAEKPAASPMAAWG